MSLNTRGQIRWVNCLPSRTTSRISSAPPWAARLRRTEHSFSVPTKGIALTCRASFQFRDCNLPTAAEAAGICLNLHLFREADQHKPLAAASRTKHLQMYCMRAPAARLRRYGRRRFAHAWQRPWSAIFPNTVRSPRTASIQPRSLFTTNTSRHYGTGTFSASSNSHERSDQFTMRLDHKITNTQHFAPTTTSTMKRLQRFSNFQAAGDHFRVSALSSPRATNKWNLSSHLDFGLYRGQRIPLQLLPGRAAKLNHPVSTLASVQDACGSAIPAAIVSLIQ